MAVRIIIAPEHKAFDTDRLGSGPYANASKVVRAALRLLERHESDIKAARTKETYAVSAGR